MGISQASQYTCPKLNSWFSLFSYPRKWFNYTIQLLRPNTQAPSLSQSSPFAFPVKSICQSYRVFLQNTFRTSSLLPFSTATTFVQASFTSHLNYYRSLNNLNNLPMSYFPPSLYTLIKLAKCFPALRHWCMPFP